MSMFKNKFAISETVWVDPDVGPYDVQTDSRCKRIGAVAGVVAGIAIRGEHEMITYSVIYTTQSGVITDEWLPEFMLKHREV